MHCSPHTLHWTLFTVHCELCTVYCALYTVTVLWLKNCHQLAHQFTGTEDIPPDVTYVWVQSTGLNSWQYNLYHTPFFPVQCALCTLYTLNWSMNSVHCLLNSVYWIYCTLCTALNSVHCTHCMIHCILHTLYNALYTANIALACIIGTSDRQNWPYVSRATSSPWMEVNRGKRFLLLACLANKW